MCNNCKNKIDFKNLSQVFHRLFRTYVPSKCNLEEADILELRENLICIKNKIHYVDYNKQIEFLNAMIHLKDYCKYDLGVLNSLLEAYDCKGTV